MQRLPLGQQDFRQIIEQGAVYVDKTEIIYRLLPNKYYFLSRPRRFGKSLLISTLKELFQGSQELFRDLWIYDKIAWKQHPVIHISFNMLNYKNEGLEGALNKRLDRIASEYGITLEEKYPPGKFESLIYQLSAQEKVVILIDEYDKPIIDYVDNIEQAKEHRDILKNFYSIVKDSDAYIRFFFITGVSKFSQVSIFSDLNNLTDITLSKHYSTILGITNDEMLRYFSEHIQALQQETGESYNEIIQAIADYYFGYSWDGNNRVYNPFTLLTLFTEQEFGDHWFRTGTPTFLMKLIKKKQYSALDIENTSLSTTSLDKYEIDEISLIPLLFQTGYLTITRYNPKRQTLTLNYPNREVARAFRIHLLAGMNNGEIVKTDSLLVQMTDAMEENLLEKFMELFKTLLKSIAYPMAEIHENYFHSIFYLVVKMLGFYIDCEVLTIDGRIDAVVRTEKIIYIMEFKTRNTKKAIDQIKEKGYHRKYMDDPRQKMLVGIDFDTETKQMKGYEVEEAPNESDQSV